jgi:hypothetical protein
MSEGSPFCSGVVIAPRLVLTAAHCLNQIAPDSVFFGQDPASGGTSIPVVDGGYHGDYDGDRNITVPWNDIGLVALASDSPERCWSLSDDADVRGDLVLHVGFGVSQGTGGDQTKKEATMEVFDVEGDLFGVTPDSGAACFGDSGGPAFVETSSGYAVAGLTSFGVSQDCLDDGYNTLVAAHLEWIEDAVGPLPSCDEEYGDDDDLVDDDDTPNLPVQPILILGEGDGVSPRSSNHCSLGSGAATSPVLLLALLGSVCRRRR